MGRVILDIFTVRLRILSVEEYNIQRACLFGCVAEGCCVKGIYVKSSILRGRKVSVNSS